MFSRNFTFVRSGLLMKCFSSEIIFAPHSGGISWLKCDYQRCARNSNVVSLRTSTRNMPKKTKIARGTHQSSDPLKQGEEGTKGAISLNEDGQICIRIVAKPGARQSNITDISADGVGVQIAAPAREGEANEELVRYLAGILTVKKRSISLDKGSKSRQKMVTIDSAETSVDQVRERLSREALLK